MSKTNPARGMRDFLPPDVRKREYVIGVIKQVYESYGFEPLETPAVENIDTLMGKYGDEGNQLIFKILKRGEKLRESRESGESKDSLDSPDSLDSLADLALRYDLTVPLARVVANHKNDLPKFFKRYQIQPVWRADRPARGRFREFYQCDVDCIGSESMVVEAELISAVCEILEQLKFTDFVVRVNHRALLTAFVDSLSISANDTVSVLTAIDKIDKGGSELVASELERIGISETQIDRVMEFLGDFDEHTFSALQLQPSGWNRQKVAEMTEHFGSLSSANEAIEELKLFFELVESIHDYAQFNIRFDFSLVRGLSYYTGSIFEIVLTDGDFGGSIGGGGRYDGLIGMFGKEQIPACGFSLGLERILVVMEERGMFPPEIADSTPADVMVTIWSDETVADSLKLANELRAQNLRVTVYPDADKLGKQMKYADSIRVPYVCVLGESELADGTVTLKNMKTGEQKTLDRNDVAANVLS